MSAPAATASPRAWLHPRAPPHQQASLHPVPCMRQQHCCAARMSHHTCASIQPRNTAALVAVNSTVAPAAMHRACAPLFSGLQQHCGARLHAYHMHTPLQSIACASKISAPTRMPPHMRPSAQCRLHVAAAVPVPTGVPHHTCASIQSVAPPSSPLQRFCARSHVPSHSSLHSVSVHVPAALLRQLACPSHARLHPVDCNRHHPLVVHLLDQRVPHVVDQPQRLVARL